jgi:protein involved in temperature-dependent protein secretion
MTDWKQLSDDLVSAVGLRLFLIDGVDQSLFETKTVEFAVAGEDVAERAEGSPA